MDQESERKLRELRLNLAEVCLEGRIERIASLCRSTAGDAIMTMINSGVRHLAMTKGDQAVAERCHRILSVEHDVTRKVSAYLALNLFTPPHGIERAFDIVDVPTPLLCTVIKVLLAVPMFFTREGARRRALAHVEATIAEVHKAVMVIDEFDRFGLLRTEQVLVVGGGLTTDVAGFACAAYRRSTDYIRVPTTLIGLIDASVSIKVAVNHRKGKNRLGAYHASQDVILDFSFLKTLPIDQVRNVFAELVKIAVVADRDLFDQLERHGQDLVATRFGYLDGTPELLATGHEVTYEAIRVMLELEVPNLHERDLDRVIAFGHTWSPTLELAPDPPLFHGHAVTIDMALSATIAAERGYISAADRDRILSMMSGVGLAIDSPYLTPDLLVDATASIMKTRGGLLRAAMPDPIGACRFVNDLGTDELVGALAVHRRICDEYPLAGEGCDVYLFPRSVESR